jgi:undecaprenyl-diphosphatase
MSQRSPSDAALLGLAAAGFAATAVVGYAATHSRRAYVTDHRVRRAMRRRSTRAGNRAATAVSMLGEPAVQLPLSVGVSAWIARQRHRRLLDAHNYAPTVAVLAAIGAHHAIKAAFPRKRPLSARLSGKTEPSYPSGHTATTLALAMTSAMMVAKRSPRANTATPRGRRSVVAGAITIPTLVAFARVYSGRHWISDVIGGSALGVALAASTRWLLRDNTE